MDVQLPGHPYVKSPIDIACWDIAGQAAGMPLWQMMGGSAPEPVAVNSSISTGTPDEMIALIKRAAEEGYTVHSAKIGGADIGADIERIEAISSNLPRGHKVTFDVNRAWQPGVAVQVLNSVTARDWVEQPCEDAGPMRPCGQAGAKPDHAGRMHAHVRRPSGRLEAGRVRRREGQAQPRRRSDQGPPGSATSALRSAGRCMSRTSAGRRIG